jgi:hypothetical protein
VAFRKAATGVVNAIISLVITILFPILLPIIIPTISSWIFWPDMIALLIHMAVSENALIWLTIKILLPILITYISSRIFSPNMYTKLIIHLIIMSVYQNDWCKTIALGLKHRFPELEPNYLWLERRFIYYIHVRATLAWILSIQIHKPITIVYPAPGGPHEGALYEDGDMYD